MTGAATPRRAAVCALRQAPRRRQAGSTGLAFSFGRGGRRKDDAAVLLAQPSAAPVVLEPVVDAETAALRAAYVGEGGGHGFVPLRCFCAGIRTECRLWNLSRCGGGVCVSWNGRVGGGHCAVAALDVRGMHADFLPLACACQTGFRCLRGGLTFFWCRTLLPLFLVVSPIAARVKEVFTTSTSSALSGSIFGLLFGIVSGTVGRKGVGPTLAAAQAQARSWGGVSAVYSGLQTAAKVARAKNDRWNNVIGACGSGAAFSCASGGGPRAAVQGCVSFALFSYVIDGLVPSTGGDPATKTDAELLK